jgi:hypothetical protein
MYRHWRSFFDGRGRRGPSAYHLGRRMTWTFWLLSALLLLAVAAPLILAMFGHSVFPQLAGI